MNNRLVWLSLVVTTALASAASWLGGCSSSDNTAAADAGTDARGIPDATSATDAPVAIDAPAVDAADAAAPTVTGAKIVTLSGSPLQGAPGDAVLLSVVLTLSDGTTGPLPAGASVSWTAPVTVAAQDPENPGSSSSVPATGATPTAFYVSNNFRPEHPGVLFITDPGTTSDAGVTVTAMVNDAGAVSATVSILPTPVGDATRGQNLYATILACSDCHGGTGAGSPPTMLSDGGIVYVMKGTAYPFPAPPLNNAPDSGNLANDPGWSSGLLGMSASADIDNQGVALRAPMPVWLGKQGATGMPLNAQDYADIYAWLQTQTQ